jgi:NDP-4-keto-2,6-dideoxyhexose 3-C-methyltransferase
LSTIKKRNHCISCGSNLSEDIVFIGDQFPSAIFLSDDAPPPPELKSSSLNLSRCTNEACQLIQLSNHYNLQYVFDHYPYESGTTATMKKILQDVVDDAQSIINLDSDDVVLDIGGNDGTMLGLIKQPVRAKVNIDAAAGVVQTVSDPNYIHIHTQFNADAYLSLDLPKPKLITSVAMFYHLSDPLAFIKDVHKIMDNQSVWVLQMTYVGTMLRDNIIDNIVHEHVAYYSLSSLKYLLSLVGLQIADAKIVESYGGSLRVFIVKDKSAYPDLKWGKEIGHVESFEIENKTNTVEALREFDTRAQLLRSTLKAAVNHLATRCGPLWGFGASTKGNMILQFIGATDKEIPCILDNSLKKIGSKTTGTLIPIVSETEYLKNPPRYLMVLPYYYTSTFVKIIGNTLKPGTELDLFVPLPFPYYVPVSSKEKL